MKLNGHFKRYLSNIEPDARNVDDASKKHTELRGKLEADPIFGQHVIDTFLTGSYRRNTAVKPIKDVDIIVVVDEDAYAQKTPKKAFEDLRDALGRCGYGFRTEDQRRSIRVDLGIIDLDVVIARAPNGLENSLRIPDRQLNEWIETHPKAHTAWSERTNAQSKGSDGQGRFKPLVKMLKAWKSHSSASLKRPKGFTLECIAGDNFRTAEDWADVFLGTMKTIKGAYAVWLALEQVPPIPDPGIPGQSLKTGLTFPQFRDFIAKVDDAIRLSEEAIAADTVAGSVKVWRTIFGPDFPDDDDASKTSRNNGFAATTAVTTSRKSDVRESPPFA